MADHTLEPAFPLEFIVHGTPVSLQIKRSSTKLAWQNAVREASRAILPEGHWATRSSIAATLYYFPSTTMSGDIDNIVKPVLDALSHHVYIDDAQVERIVVQRFSYEIAVPFASPSRTLSKALNSKRPLLYIRLSDDPYEDFK